MTKFICKDCDTPCYYDDGDTTGKLDFTPSRCISVGEDELVPANWEKCENVNPPIEAQYGEIPEPNADADVDALLEVIKQKDAIIDNCRSSLRESYDIWLKQQGRLEHLEKQADPELYAKLTIAESKAKGLEKEIERLNEKLAEPAFRAKLWMSDLGVMSLFLIFVGGIVGWFAGLVLF